MICNSDDVCPAPLTNDPDDPVGDGSHELPSPAINRLGESVAVAWIGGPPGTPPYLNTSYLRTVRFEFDLAPFEPPRALTPAGTSHGPGEREPSAGIDASALGAYWLAACWSVVDIARDYLPVST